MARQYRKTSPYWKKIEKRRASAKQALESSPSDCQSIKVDGRTFRLKQRYGFVITHDVQIGSRETGRRYVKEYFGSWEKKEEAQKELDKILCDNYGSESNKRWNIMAELAIIPGSCHVVEMYQLIPSNPYVSQRFLVTMPEQGVYKGCL